MACAPSADASAKVQCSLQLSPSPAHVGPALAELTLSEDGRPLEQASLTVQGNMNHAGMVPSQARVTELGAGHYKAEFEFTMGGDWILIVDGKLADGRSFERTLPMPGVASK
ncbi:MAG: FixH family protein [Planctomycetes bacterium]|nr:FixH family protein [Planctomycetota bacterium]